VLDTHAESCFFSEDDWFFFAVRFASWIPDDRQAALILDDLSRDELHWLEVASRSGWLQTSAFECGSNVCGGSTMAFAAGFAPG